MNCGSISWIARPRCAMRRRMLARAEDMNDYPTSARAEYVFGCLKANGETRQAIEQCSCSIDVVASLLPYDRYVKAETVLSMSQVRGNLAANSALRRRRPARSTISAAHRQKPKCGVFEEQRNPQMRLANASHIPDSSTSHSCWKHGPRYPWPRRGSVSLRSRHR